MKKKEGHSVNNTIFKIFLFFIIFSFIGWVLEKIVLLFFNIQRETSFMLVLLGKNIPFLPIYGFGALILLALSNILKRFKLCFFLRVLINGFVLTIYELLSGLFTTYLLGIRFWDYSSHILNFDGHISLMAFIFWIFIGLIFETIEEILKKRKKR